MMLTFEQQYPLHNRLLAFHFDQKIRIQTNIHSRNLSTTVGHQPAAGIDGIGMVRATGRDSGSGGGAAPQQCDGLFGAVGLWATIFLGFPLGISPQDG